MYFTVALNKKAIFQSYVTLYSISVNHIGEPICVYVLHTELDEEECGFLAQALGCDADNHRAEFLYVDPSVIPELPCNSFWSIEAYYRLLLTDMLPKDIDRILYLDIDMIVNKNLRDFYFQDFEDNHMVVSRDMEFHNILELKDEYNRRHNELFSQLVQDGMVYFCSGMILYNISLLRELGYGFDRYIQVFDEMAEYFTLFDQDLLNYVHWKNVKYADENLFGIFAPTAHTLGKTYEEIKQDAFIIHFTGAAKPWTVNLLRYDIEKIWWEYCKASPFYYELMENVFFNSMESTFTEKHINKLVEENKALRDIAVRFEEIIKKIQGQ